MSIKPDQYLAGLNRQRGEGLQQLTGTFIGGDIMKPALITTVLMAAAALSACAGGLDRRKDDTAAQRYQDYAGGPVEGFNIIRLDGWTPVSRNRLVVWNAPSEAYLVTVWTSCPDLQFADRIGVTSTTRRVSKFESIRVGDQRCPISEIRPIDVKQMRDDQRQARR
jgi:hypothetical protein